MQKDHYFKKINIALKKHHQAIPFLLLDLDKLDQNIATLKTSFNPNANFRIVVKSLPSFDLISYIMKSMNTNRLMVFHQPFLTDLSSKLDAKADVLLGKPMPVKTAEYYYNHLPQQNQGFNPYQQIQWLVDTESRVHQYIELANRLGEKLHLNLELDVGLHRGGFKNLQQLRVALQLLTAHVEKVDFSGFMGYDPHVVKLPSIVRSQKKSLALSNTFYHQCRTLLKEEFPALCENPLTFNGAGSPTINLHTIEISPLNDIAAGSCLVKPTTFDIPSLADYVPACYIASPILKKFKGTTLPGLEKFKPIFNFMNRRHRQSFFIYGGYWKADYCYPVGVQENSLFGPSTNQTMLNAPESDVLDVDDFVFLRPHQSEFVFLQFGKILAFRGNDLKEEWSLLQNY